MLEQKIIQATERYVKRTLANDSSHDWWHVYRVWQLAKYIGIKEKANLFLIEMAALLHDVEDWKFHTTNKHLVKNWLQNIGVKHDVAKDVLDIIDNISFRGAKVAKISLSLEGQIVQDADRLDAIGAIGIARTFAYGGHVNREIHNPEILSILHDDPIKYRTHKGTTINHFYEKLLLLKDKMNTTTAKKIAESRHQVMLTFLQTFLQEWNADTATYSYDT